MVTERSESTYVKQQRRASSTAIGNVLNYRYLLVHCCAALLELADTGSLSESTRKDLERLRKETR